jgi:NADPH:quinone reductase-like Zn-dependent oxidoreductase
VRGLWTQLIGWWRQSLLRPEIHARFPLDRFREAMAEVRGRRAANRVVLLPPGAAAGAAGKG